MDELTGEVVGALNQTINAHGPITDAEVGSAAKRIAAAIREAAKRERDRLMATPPRQGNRDKYIENVEDRSPWPWDASADDIANLFYRGKQHCVDKALLPVAFLLLDSDDSLSVITTNSPETLREILVEYATLATERRLTVEGI